MMFCKFIRIKVTEKIADPIIVFVANFMVRKIGGGVVIYMLNTTILEPVIFTDFFYTGILINVKTHCWLVWWQNSTDVHHVFGVIHL